VIAATFGLELLRVHKGWAWFVVIGNGLAGLWALGAHWLRSLRTRALWWFTGLVEVAIFVQVILGVIMVSHQKLVAPKFHMFYGFVAIFAVALIYSYRHQLKSRLYLLYGFGGLFLMGLAIRAMLVASP
jgi:Co/Zn/Cd efflux system component